MRSKCITLYGAASDASKLDRLVRSPKDLVENVTELETQEIGSQFLNEYVGTTNATGNQDTVVINIQPIGNLCCDPAPLARRRLGYTNVCTMH